MGRNFEKIEFSLWGLQFFEPNNLITDFSSVRERTFLLFIKWHLH
jgi:hypothetical protein